MRKSPWPGLRQDTTDVGEDNLTELHNVQLRIAQELRDRPGLGDKYATGATVQRISFLEASGNRCLISYLSAGSLSSFNVDTSAVNTLASSLTASMPGCFAGALGALYWVNGTDSPRVTYNGTTGYTAGIVGPASAPTAGAASSGVVTAGIHLIRYRYKNSSTGYFSDPSSALSFTAAGSQNCPLTLVASVDAKVDKIVVEMTEAAGSTFYVVATTSNGTSYTINMNDATLAQQQQSDIYSAPDGYGMDPPPSALFAICEHKSRLFGIDATGTLYWSRQGFPEGWNVLNWARKVFSTGGDKPVGLGSFFGDLYIFGTRSIARLVYTTDPAIGDLVQIPGNLGVWSQQAVVGVEGMLFGWGRQGIFNISAIQPELISQPIQHTAQNDIDGAYAATTAHVFFDPQERVVWFMYRSVSDSSVRSAICLDLQTKQWSTRSFRHTIAASVTAGSTTSASYAYLSDNNGGYTWKLTDAVWDGVPASLSTGVVTATAGGTTTIIPVAQTLPASGLAGAILYHPVTGEESLISDNDSSSITCAALAEAPAAGTELYIGSIQQTICSGHVPMHYAFVGRRPDFLRIEHASTPDALGVTVQVQYYVDYSATAFVFTQNADDQQLSGQSIVNGNNYATQLLDNGKAMIPVPSDFETVIQWKMTRNRPAGHMRLLDCGFDTRDQRRAQDVPH